MKKITPFFVVLLWIQLNYSQVGIGTTLPNGALDINSSTNGLVIPRVALTSKALAAPVVNPQTGALTTGTMVYNTSTLGVAPNNVVPGFYFWNGTRWEQINNGTTNESKLISNVTQPNPNLVTAPSVVSNTAAQSFDATTITKTVNVAGFVGVQAGLDGTCLFSPGCSAATLAACGCRTGGPLRCAAGLCR